MTPQILRLSALGRYSLTLLLTVAACGGSGGSVHVTVKVEGHWTGQMSQSSAVTCSDGSVIGGGFGSPTRVVSFDISSGSSAGDELSATLDGCVYKGRQSDPSHVELFSLDESCSESLLLSDVGTSAVTLTIDPRPASAVVSGGVVCVSGESGIVYQQN